jgi:hypothetical protein
MRYREVEAEVRSWVESADEPVRHRFARQAILALTHLIRIEHLFGGDLDENAWRALERLMVEPERPMAELSAALAEIDAGILADGDMAPELVTLLDGFDTWRDWLADRHPDAVYRLAILNVEHLDFLLSPSLDDYLAEPEMARLIDRFRSMLTGSPEIPK